MKNREYEPARNKLIPVAESYANEKAGAHPKSAHAPGEWAKLWNRAFLGEMDRLAKERGLMC